MIWDNLTTEETKKISKTTPVIVLLCATEQHGPHLPLSTDRLIGEHFLHELNRLMEKEVILLPVIPIGCSEHHMDFSGSLTFKHATFKTLVEEMVESMVVHEFKNFLFLNSHGGNQGIGQVILETLGNKYSDCQFSLITWWKIAGDELKKINESGSGGTGHAGEFETSLMLHIAPKLVREKHVKPLTSQQFDPLVGDMINPPKFSYFQTIKQISENGVVGNPSFSTKEQGEKISQIVTSKLVELIKSSLL
jgi:creatinine amidohydrolase